MSELKKAISEQANIAVTFKLKRPWWLRIALKFCHADVRKKHEAAERELIQDWLNETPASGKADPTSPAGG